MVSIGCVIKNPGNTRNNKTGSWRTFKPVLDKEKCIDCENCIIFCPDSTKLSEESFFFFLSLFLGAIWVNLSDLKSKVYFLP